MLATREREREERRERKRKELEIGKVFSERILLRGSNEIIYEIKLWLHLLIASYVI